MKEIPLNRGFVALISDEDYERVNQFRWTVIERKSKNKILGIYVQRSFKKSSKSNDRGIMLLHRFVLNVTDPRIPIDHKDGNGLNNTRENLRIATHSRNVGNSKKIRKNSSSKYKGVCFRKDTLKWMAYIKVGAKQIRLGCYVFEVDAARKYDEAARRIFGEFCRLNFPEKGEQSALKDACLG